MVMQVSTVSRPRREYDNEDDGMAKLASTLGIAGGAIGLVGGVMTGNPALAVGGAASAVQGAASLNALNKPPQEEPPEQIQKLSTTQPQSYASSEGVISDNAAARRLAGIEQSRQSQRALLQDISGAYNDLQYLPPEKQPEFQSALDRIKKAANQQYA